MTQLFVNIGDIHGSSEVLNRIIEYYNDRYQDDLITYVFHGDLIDRGLTTKEVIEKVISIPNKIVVRGNHEQMLIDVIDNPENPLAVYNWVANGGANVLLSYGMDKGLIEELVTDAAFEKLGLQIFNIIPNHVKEFLKSTVLYHDTGSYLFVHAGVHPEKTLQEQTPNHLLWIRHNFLLHKGEYGVQRFVVHGHTPDLNFNKIATQHRLNLDGGYVFGGFCGTCVIDPERMFPLAVNLFFQNGEKFFGYKELLNKG